MRSHMMKFYAEDKASKLENGEDFTHDFQSFRSYSLPSSSSEEEYDEEEREAVLGVVSSYELRENPKKSALLLDHEFPSVVVQGGDSETESSEKIPICRRRSKRARETRISDFGVFKVRKRTKFVVAADDEQSSPLSSISDTTPEEHVAHCLIMLSKDKWEKEEREYVEEEDEEDEEESKKFGNEDIFEDSGVAKMAKNKFRGKYRCEECNKLFRSYQALGGHRASHKKIKVNTPAPPPPLPKAEAKVHQCPFCERIFSSGQALGGHKRTHFIGAGAIPTNYNNSIDKASRISQAFSIDLNLPAPAEEDEIAISAVSDAEFVHSVKE